MLYGQATIEELMADKSKKSLYDFEASNSI